MVFLGYYVIPIIFFIFECFYYAYTPAKITKSINHNHGKKMSEVILNFSEPLRNDCKNFQEEKDIIDLSIVAWNLSVNNKHVDQKMIENKLKKWCGSYLNKGAKKKIIHMIDKLIDRKKRYFKKYDFTVINYSFSELDEENTYLRVFGHWSPDKKTIK